MHELARPGQRSVAAHSLLDEVFDRLDVMVGAAFDRLDARTVVDAKRFADGQQRRTLILAESRQVGDSWVVGQRQQPGGLDLHATMHQTVFTEDRAQRRRLRGITAIER